MTEAKVVKYKGEYYLWYKTNEAGFAQLVDANGNKFPGTPQPGKLEVVKTIPNFSFNGHDYVSTKLGVFSLATGNLIKDQNILKLAK